MERSESLQRDIVELARALRDANLPIGLDQTEAFANALGWIDSLSRREVYLAARASFVFRREDLPVFDQIFDSCWRAEKGAGAPQKVPMAPRHDPALFHRTALVSYMSEKSNPNAPEMDVPEEAKAANDTERLLAKDFGDMSDEERAAMAAAIRALKLNPAWRKTRRRTSSRRGKELDMRKIVREAARHGGRAFRLARQTQKRKRRPLVILADVSGSMELYTRVLLQFFHAVAQTHAQSETFVFGTRLTCITNQLRIRDVDHALDHTAKEVVDFAGGTRIGQCMELFNRRHAQRVLRRGAVVLVISDGWETGDVTQLETAMRRLRGRCHRLIWLNPLLGGARYEPLAQGMAAALPYVDDFLPIANMQSMKQLAAHLASLPERKTLSRSKDAAQRRGIDEASR